MNSNSQSGSTTHHHHRHTRYTITPKHSAAHLFEVTVSIDQPDPAGQRFMLPTWIPGSYMIREFARNIITLSAACGGTPSPWKKSIRQLGSVHPASQEPNPSSPSR